MSDQITTTSVLALFETDKEQRAYFVQDIVSRIESGSIDALKVHLQVKCMEDIINKLTVIDEKKNPLSLQAKSYRSALMDSAEKYGAKKFNYMNASFEIKEVGVKYDFSKCEDIGLQRMYDDQEKLSEAIKQRETLLKSVPAKGMVITDEDTGETYTVFPPAKSSTTSISVSLK